VVDDARGADQEVQGKGPVLTLLAILGARAVKRAMLWMGDRRAEQVRELVISGMARPDSDADLHSIRQEQQTMSPDGVVAATVVKQ
jgi:hypothetical protein